MCKRIERGNAGNNASLEAIRSSLDSIQYTIEDIKLIADDIHTTHREQHVKLQHVAVMAKHVVSICNFILSVSTTEENNDNSIPPIVENIILWCRKIDDIANTLGLVTDEDLLKLTSYINNIILLRNRIYTIILVGNYKRQTNIQDNSKHFNTTNKVYSVYIKLNKISNVSIFQSDGKLIKHRFCTIQDYFKYLFLPKVVKLTTIKTITSNIGNSTFHGRRMWRKVKYYTLLFNKLNRTFEQNTDSESSVFTETNQNDFNDTTKHSNYLDIISFIYKHSNNVVPFSTDLPSSDERNGLSIIDKSSTETYNISPPTQEFFNSSEYKKATTPDSFTKLNISNGKMTNVENITTVQSAEGTTTLENSFMEVEYSGSKMLYRSEDITPFPYNDAITNTNETDSIQPIHSSIPTVEVLTSDSEYISSRVENEGMTTTYKTEDSSILPYQNTEEATTGSGYSNLDYTTPSYDEDTTTSYKHGDSSSLPYQDTEEATTTSGYSNLDYTTSSYDEDTTTTYKDADSSSLPYQDTEEATTTSGHSNVDYTTSSYDEASVTETTEYIEVTTELDKYKLSQDIYNIAQDMYSKASEMSSVTSEISSKISDISNLISDVNTDEDEVREKVQKLNRYTQDLSSKTNEISSLSSEASRLSSDISSASQDIPSSEKVQSHRTTPWQKITQKSQDLITATQSIVTASQEVLIKSREVSTLSENLKPANAIANGIYDINSRTQGLITEALDIVTAVVEILTLVQL